MGFSFRDDRVRFVQHSRMPARRTPEPRPDPKRDSHHPGASGTNWPLLRAASGGGPDAQASLQAVTKRYWAPIYSFVRAAGSPPVDAVDLTQGFIADVLLGRTLLASADARRGRFRAFLRQAVIHYVRDRVRGEKARKRMPKDGPPARLGSNADALAALDGVNAARAFDAHWAAQTVRVAAERTARRLNEEGRTVAWTMFERRTLRPSLTGEAAPSYDRLIEELGLQSIGQAAHAAIVGRRAFLEELIGLVRETLGPGEHLEDELRALRAALEAPR